MNDLLNRIHEAQVTAAEDVVVDDLRRKGLLPPKMAIVIDLDQLQRLMQEFIGEYSPDDPSTLEYQWRFSAFLYWLRKRMETTDGSSHANGPRN